MTDTNTPRTAAIRKALGIGYVSWSRGDGWYATQGKDGVTYDEAEAAFKEAYAALDAIEAEAAAPTPAEPLDVERLARAISNVSGDGRVLDVDREETRKVAAEYNRLAAARPEGQTPALREAVANLTASLLISQDGESVSGETAAVLWLTEVIRLSQGQPDE